MTKRVFEGDFNNLMHGGRMRFFVRLPQLSEDIVVRDSSESVDAKVVAVISGTHPEYLEIVVIPDWNTHREG
jgi:hypothetical protein